MGNEQARYRRIPEIGGLELLHAAYSQHSFSPHFHKGHVIGVIEKGELGFDYRGEKLVACQGQINLADPGEVHNGFAVSKAGWQYRMFYLAQGQLESLLRDGADRPVPFPGFRKGVIRDTTLAGELFRLHKGFEDPCIDLLENQSRFYLLMRGLVLRHAPETIPAVKNGRERAAVGRIKEYLDAHFDLPVSLDDLTGVSGMSKYYLIRVFSAETGMTPHAWLTQVRADKARGMIGKGLPLADVAAAAGFFDQSHMNRIFKKVFGITPGQYISG